MAVALIERDLGWGVCCLPDKKKKFKKEKWIKFADHMNPNISMQTNHDHPTWVPFCKERFVYQGIYF